MALKVTLHTSKDKVGSVNERLTLPNKPVMSFKDAFKLVSKKYKAAFDYLGDA